MGEGTPESRVGAERRSEMAAAAGAGLLVVSVGLLFLVYDSSFFWHDDFQLQHLPGSREIARSWLEDRSFPLLSRFSWMAGALAGEFLYGVFSVFLTVLNLLVWNLGLSLPATAAFLALTHLMVLGAGAYLLARSYDVSPALSCMVAIVASLNGYQVAWAATNWYPVITSFAWLPWFWWTLHRIARPPRSRFLPFLSGFFLYLLVSAGWPFTILMAMLVTAVFAVNALRLRDLRQIMAIATAGSFGTALSLPALLALTEHLSTSIRGQETQMSSAWFVPLDALPGLILPTHRTGWVAYGFIQRHHAIELAGAFVPLAGVVTALAALRKRFLRESQGLGTVLAILGAALALMLIPTDGAFRWSFRWLPLFHLAMALAGAIGLASVNATRAAETQPSRFAAILSRSNPGSWASLLVIAGLVATLTLDGVRAETLVSASALFVLALIWSALAATPAAPAARWMPALLAIFTVWSIYGLVPVDHSVPTWKMSESVRRAAPFDPSLRYLGLYRWRDIALKPDASGAPTGTHPEIRPGNVPMFAGIEFINGYSSMRPEGIARVFGLHDHGEMRPRIAEAILRREVNGGGFLEAFSIDGLLVPDDLFRAAGPLDRWRLAGEIPGAKILHRIEPLRRTVYSAREAVIYSDSDRVVRRIFGKPEDPLPILLLGPNASNEPVPFSPARLARVDERRLSVSVDVDTAGNGHDSLLVFSRPWFTGYEAFFDGKPVAVEVAYLSIPAIRVPKGTEGRLVLRYRPSSVFRGGIASAGALVVLLAACAIRFSAVTSRTP